MFTSTIQVLPLRRVLPGGVVEWLRRLLFIRFVLVLKLGIQNLILFYDFEHFFIRSDIFFKHWVN